MKKFLSGLFLFLPTIIVLIFTLIFKFNPEITQKIQGGIIFPFFSSVITYFTSKISFSLAEVLILLCPIFLITVLIIFIYNVRKCTEKKNYIIKAFKRAVCFLNVLLIIFMCNHGFNYYNVSLQDQFKINTSNQTTDDLYRVCVLFAQEANAERENMNKNKSFSDVYEDVDQVIKVSNKGYEVLSRKYSFIPKVKTVPKKVQLSHLWSYTGITGMYFPLTCEANINIDVPKYTIPYTVLHELAHTIGYAKESEANFMAFLSAVNHPNATFRYSGYISAFTRCFNELYNIDQNLAQNAILYLNDDVSADISISQNYWQKHEGTVQEVSTVANDVFLKVNNQSEGVQSYNDVVQLLVGYYS